MLKVLLPLTVLIHYSSMHKHLSKSGYSRKNTLRIGLKKWHWLWVEVMACGISWSESEKEWNLQEWSTISPHSLGVLFFSLGLFKECNTILWKHTCYDLQVFQNFQDKSITLGGVFTKAFPRPPSFFPGTETLIDTDKPCPVHRPK